MGFFSREPREIRCVVGAEPLGVVGEASYQPALIRVSGAPGSGEWEAHCHAWLELDPRNQYDPDAVKVLIDGALVGYLARGNAKAWHPRARQMKDEGLVCACRVGRKDGGKLGVTLYVPADWP